MQLGLDIGAAATFAVIRERLQGSFGPYDLAKPRAPIAQLVKSMVSSRTYDRVSLAAFLRLIERFPTWGELTDAAPGQIAAAIAEVQWPEQKALHLRFWSTAELQDLHVLIKVLGQIVCRASEARCAGCPIRNLCPSTAERPAPAGMATACP